MNSTQQGEGEGGSRASEGPVAGARRWHLIPYILPGHLPQGPAHMSDPAAKLLVSGASMLVMWGQIFGETHLATRDRGPGDAGHCRDGSQLRANRIVFSKG